MARESAECGLRGQMLPDCLSCECGEQTRANCPFRQMPRWAYAMVRLYGRCSRWGTLPRPGGLDQQDQRTMRCFDLIDSEVESARREHQRREEMAAKRNP